METYHLPFDRLKALSKVEGRRYSHPASLRRTVLYASFLGISKAPACGGIFDLHLAGFRQPPNLLITDRLLGVSV